MATVFLVRHGLTAMTGPVLAGRTPGTPDGAAFVAGRALALGGSAMVALTLLGLLRGVDLAAAASAPTKDRELAW